MNLKERTYLWYIAPLRIYVGYYMLQQGIRKFQRIFRAATGSVGKSATSLPSTCTHGTKFLC